MYSATSLHYMCMLGPSVHNVAMASLLVEYGADVNDVGGGHSPLLVISAWGDIQLMEWLLDHGAAIHYVGDGGYTAVHNAAEAGNLEAYQWLLEHGVDPELRLDPSKTRAVANCGLQLRKRC